MVPRGQERIGGELEKDPIAARTFPRRARWWLVRDARSTSVRPSAGTHMKSSKLAMSGSRGSRGTYGVIPRGSRPAALAAGFVVERRQLPSDRADRLLMAGERVQPCRGHDVIPTQGRSSK